MEGENESYIYNYILNIKYKNIFIIISQKNKYTYIKKNLFFFQFFVLCFILGKVTGTPFYIFHITKLCKIIKCMTSEIFI